MFGSFSFSSITSALSDFVDLDGKQSKESQPPTAAAPASPSPSPSSALPKSTNIQFHQDKSTEIEAKQEGSTTEGEIKKEILENLAIAKNDVVSFFEDVGSIIKATVEEEKKLLEKEREAGTKKSSGSSKSLYAPWENLAISNPVDQNACAAEILQIARNRRNFENAPPAEESDFSFAMSDFLDVAQVALEKDPQLSRARFVLVPKSLSEEEFWRRYFYRVHVVKMAYGILLKQSMTSPSKPALPPSSSSQVSAGSEASLKSSSDTLETKSSTASHEVDAEPSPPLKEERVVDSVPKRAVDFASEFHDEDEDEETQTFALKNSIRESLTSSMAPADDTDDLLSFDTEVDLNSEIARELELELELDTGNQGASTSAKIGDADWIDY